MTSAVFSVASDSSRIVSVSNSSSSSSCTSSLLRVLHVFTCALMVLVALFAPGALQKSLNIAHPEWFSANSSHVTIVTLAFNQTNGVDLAMIAHNCAMLSRSNHSYHIHVDNTSHAFCSRCQCVRFVRKRCSCPNASAANCALCEKLHFVMHALQRYKQMLFLDSDVIVLRDDFVPRLLARTTHFDFLAAYGFEQPCNKRYASAFNSGLMFMRAIANVNYTHMVQMMWHMNDNNDQNVISRFVHTHYANWDTLSLRWHCRYLHKRVYDIPPHQCYTFHGRSSALKQFLSSFNSSPLLQTWD